MFVQEEKIFAGKVLKVHVCTMEGTEWLEEVTEDTTIEKLKEKCLKHVGLLCHRLAGTASQPGQDRPARFSESLPSIFSNLQTSRRCYL